MSRPDAALALPSEWESVPRGDGGTELRINRRGGLAVYVFGGLSIIYFSMLFGSWIVHRTVPPLPERVGAIAPGIFLVALTAWCAVARECWIVRAGAIEKSMGIGSRQAVTRYSGDHLEIAQRFSFLWNVPYYRLYVVDGEQRQFLMERMKPEDIQALSAYIAAATGWRAPTSITTRLL
jgi:hypothetical protein